MSTMKLNLPAPTNGLTLTQQAVFLNWVAAHPRIPAGLDVRKAAWQAIDNTFDVETARAMACAISTFDMILDNHQPPVSVINEVGRMEVRDTTTGASDAMITRGDETIGVIEKEVYDAGRTSHEWRTEGYQVNWFVDGYEDRWFPVSDHRSARHALAAAKRFVRGATPTPTTTEA